MAPRSSRGPTCPRSQRWGPPTGPSSRHTTAGTGIPSWGGQTPLTALQRAGQPLRFPDGRGCPSAWPLPRPETGYYPLVRFIRSDRRLDIFGERLLLSPEAEYADVLATVHVAQERLRVMLGADQVAELPSPLR